MANLACGFGLRNTGAKLEKNLREMRDMCEMGEMGEMCEVGEVTYKHKIRLAVEIFFPPLRFKELYEVMFLSPSIVIVFMSWISDI